MAALFEKTARITVNERRRRRLFLSKKLLSGQSVLTVELSPPKGTDLGPMVRRAQALKGRVDAINVPDCQRSILKMSSLAAAKCVQDATGIETVWQLTCRDRNLIALQADLLGAYAMGIRTVLALTGDPVQVGDQKDVAKQVFHLDAVRLLELLTAMNLGLDATGDPFPRGGVQLCVGSALNPAKLTLPAQQNRLRHKLARGVHFFQTQPIYDLATAETTMRVVHQCAQEVGCKPPKVLIGLIPPKNAEAALRLNRNVMGIQIPETLISRLTEAEDPWPVSVDWCAQLVARLHPVVDGFHVMPVGVENRLGDILDACFLPLQPVVPSL
jgi:methylenetetrahydrofolate reductase (NADPH)